MGRHSRKGRAKAGQPSERAVPRGDVPPSYGMAEPGTGEIRSQAAYGPGDPRDPRDPRDGAPSTSSWRREGYAGHADGYGRGPAVRGGHPELREPGGGWGADGSGRWPEDGDTAGRVLQGTHGAALGAGQLGGPRQEYIDAFEDGVFGKNAGAAVSSVRAPAPRYPGGGQDVGRGSGVVPSPVPSPGPGVVPGSGPGSGPGPGGGYAVGELERGTGRSVDGRPVPGRLLPDPGPAPLRGPRGRGPATPGPWNAYERPVAFAQGGGMEKDRGRREETGAGADGGLPRAAPPPRVPGQAVRAGMRGGSSKGRAVTGVLAAAVTTVLAFVIAGQFNGGAQSGDDGAEDAAGAERGLSAEGPASRSGKGRGTPDDAQGAALSYTQKMGKTFSLDSGLKGKGDFKAVPGSDEGVGGSEVMRYRVDVEKGLPLESDLFADAVQKTLNDKRSWAHGGERSFERVSKGDVDFVITLASSPTTDVWCAKSGLDTSEQNVSCDSASTDRIMINAYRWAQGSKTFGDKKILGYRQMLINHEVGHRIGRDHVGCPKDGDLAPVMMQQTKSLTSDGAKCRPNPWPYPRD